MEESHTLLPNLSLIVLWCTPVGLRPAGIVFGLQPIPFTSMVKNARTIFGDYTFLTGSTASLGNWSTTWDGTVGPMLPPNRPGFFPDLSLQASQTVEFDFIKIAGGRTASWELA